LITRTYTVDDFECMPEDVVALRTFYGADR